MVIYLSVVADWDKIQNILLFLHGEICIIAYGTLFIQEPLLQNFVRMPCVVNDYGATCVASKTAELFFSQKMQRVLEECLMTIRF